MKNPDEILKKQENSNGYEYNSHLAGISLELANEIQTTNYEVAKQLLELSQSYRSLRVSALQSYLHLYQYYSKYSKIDNEIYHISFMLQNFVYSLITQSKTSLDLMVCILHCIENKNFVSEYELTDFTKYSKSKTANTNIISHIKEISEKEWYGQLSTIRNRIIHRGFEISFDFNSVDFLSIHLDKTNKEEIKPQIEFFVSKNSTLLYKKDEEDLDNGFIKDHHGRIKAKIDLDKLMDGFIEIENIEKIICETLIKENIIENITQYEPLKTGYGANGQMISHPKILAVKKACI